MSDGASADYRDAGVALFERFGSPRLALGSYSKESNHLRFAVYR